MAKKEFPADRPMTVKGAGPVIRSNQVILVKAYADQDLEIITAQRSFYESLAKVLAEYRAADNKQYDMLMSGYTDASWAKGLERLVKKDPDKPRGRKAAVKADPADDC
jgi:hypothetical protein